MNPSNTTATPSAAPQQPIRVYRDALSGHCHRVELFLSLLGLPFELVNVNLANGDHKKPDFLRISPLGQIPAIEDGDVALADSNAILVYLTQRYAGAAVQQWLPTDPVRGAQVQRWLSAAAGPLAYGPCAARIIQLFNLPDDPSEAVARGHALFKVMEQQLAETAFLAGDTLTLADIANYSYVARAPEGNISLLDYPRVRAWLARVEALPRFLPMVKTPVGLPA